MTAKRTRASDLLDQFTSYRSELDAHYAQRERIVKLSRDITALSKKLIFALHRIGSGRGKKAVFEEAEGKMGELRALFEQLQGEVQGEAFWRYERSVSPGIQEYLEGFTFYYYLQHHSLPTLAEAQASLLPPNPAPLSAASTSSAAADAQAVDPSSPADSPAPTADPSSSSSSSSVAAPPPAQPTPEQPYVLVSVEDYLGGVADLTGELMRLAIASVGRNLSDSLGGAAVDGADGKSEGDFANIEYIGRVVREIKGEMDPLAVHCRWLPKKIQVLNQSLAKIENASYNLRIRGAEYKGSPAMLQALARKMAEAPSGGGGGRDEVEAAA
ncbi:hypothetical protein JCM6882_003450 [Rhodosporidiobolus microsporus]